MPRVWLFVWRAAKRRDYTRRPFHRGPAPMNQTLVKKLSIALGALLVAGAAQADGHKLTKLWESEATLKVPESVRFDAQRKVLYVSNIDGQPWEADGKGS